MKIRITIDVESDKPLNSVAQKAKYAAENAVIEILQSIKSNMFVNSTVHEIDNVPSYTKGS